MIDSFTGLLEVVPLHKVEATDVATAFLSSWITRYGALDRLLSDQESNVAGEVIKGLCDVLKTKKIRTTPYHPQVNGKAERAIGTVKLLLRAVTNQTYLFGIMLFPSFLWLMAQQCLTQLALLHIASCLVMRWCCLRTPT